MSCTRCVIKTSGVLNCLTMPFLLPQPIYGFASGDPLRFKRAAGHNDLFYINDKDVEFKDVSSCFLLLDSVQIFLLMLRDFPNFVQVIETPLSKAPLDTAVVAHWLAIEGVQPAILENAPVDGISIALP